MRIERVSEEKLRIVFDKEANVYLGTAHGIADEGCKVLDIDDTTYKKLLVLMAKGIVTKK